MGIPYTERHRERDLERFIADPLLSGPERRLRIPRFVRGRRLGRGDRRPHGADQLRRADAVPLRCVRRLGHADPAEAPVRGLHGCARAGVHGRELRSGRHRAVHGGRVPSQRRGALRGQRALPRPRSAGVLVGAAEGRRRRGVRGTRGAGDRRVRLRLEPAGGAGDPAGHGASRQGRGGHRVRDAGRAPGDEQDQPRPEAGRYAVGPTRTAAIRTRSCPTRR